MEAIIEGNKIFNVNDFHKSLKVALNLPEYYGENLDALWDCITGQIEMPTTIIWKDFAISQKYLGGYSDKVLQLFKDAEHEIANFKIIID